MRLVALLFVALSFIACKDYNPGPLNPVPSEAGKRHCSSNSDCAGGICGRDGRCM